MATKTRISITITRRTVRIEEGARQAQAAALDITPRRGESRPPVAESRWWTRLGRVLRMITPAVLLLFAEAAGAQTPIDLTPDTPAVFLGGSEFPAPNPIVNQAFGGNTGSTLTWEVSPGQFRYTFQRLQDNASGSGTISISASRERDR